MSGLLCAGDVYFDRFDDAGVSTGLIFFGNTTKFALKESVESKTRLSRGRDNYNTVLDSVQLPAPSAFSMTSDEFDGANVALALLGVSTAINIAPGSVLDEVVVARALGAYVPLLRGNVSSVVVTNTVGTTTYVAGTDYEVHARLGWIKPLTGGAITAAQSLKVDYSYAAETGVGVTGKTKTLIKGRLFLDGINLANQKKVHVIIPRTSLGPNADIDFKSGDFAGVEFVGSPELLTGSATTYGFNTDASHYVKYLD